MTDKPENSQRPGGAFSAFSETEFIGLGRATRGYVPGDGVGNVMRQNWSHFGFDGWGPARPGTLRPTHEPYSAPSPEITTAAKVIAGGNPSEWLIRKLVVLAPMVIKARTEEETQPTRVEMMKRLDAIDPNILSPLLSIVDPSSQELLLHLEQGGEYPIDPGTLIAFRRHLIGLLEILPEFANRAKQARDRLDTGAGKGRAWSRRNALDAKDLCAVIVTESWRRVRSDPLPDPSNSKLHCAGEAFWIATRGIKPWGNTNSRWRKHFTKARNASHERDLIIWILEDLRAFRHNPPIDSA
jgi:hypothetical protein